MTNTHINVGGHKITTNKVGVQHTISSGFGTGFSGRIDWVVVNGLCIVGFHPLTNANTGSAQTILTTLPKSKFTTRVLTGLSNGNGSGMASIVFMEPGTGTLKGTFQSAVSSYGEIIYPVADDWVEG